MASYGLNDVKQGTKILVDGNPCVVVSSEFVKPGKGQAFTRMRIRNLLSGRTSEKTLKSSDSFEGADVVELDMQFLYDDGEFWYFMQPENFEQHQVEKTAMADAAQWLKGEEQCVVTLWNDRPITVEPPNFVDLKIVETDPGVRGDTSAGGSKPATLETGAVVRVPLFVDQDEFIRVDTRTGAYASRLK